MKEKCKYKIKVFKLKCFNSKFALDYFNCVSWYWSCQEDSRGTLAKVRQVSMREIKEFPSWNIKCVKNPWVHFGAQRKDTPWSLWRGLNELILKIDK